MLVPQTAASNTSVHLPFNSSSFIDPRQEPEPGTPEDLPTKLRTLGARSVFSTPHCLQVTDMASIFVNIDSRYLA